MRTIYALPAASLLASVHIGQALYKDDPKAAEKALEALHQELADVTQMLTVQKQAVETQYTELNNHFTGLKSSDAETKAAVEKHTAEYAEMVKTMQALTVGLDDVKKQMDNPTFKTGGEKKDGEVLQAIELQRRAAQFKGIDEDVFVPNMDNLVDVAAYKSAARKLAKVGIDTKEQIVRSFTDAEKKAFESASLDSAFFMPEMLGIEIDCEIECAELLDLYDSISVSRSTFMFPHVTDYGAIGQYDCDAKCDAEMGPEGNITYRNGKTYDWRGVFCLQRKVLAEANYDLLGFMFRAAARSYRINRNRALITGDGINEPLGWLTADCFTKIATSDLAFDPKTWRLFWSSAPVEYGPVTATMHQNVFAYLAAFTDCCGRFMFGDGEMSFGPDQVDNIRISNCLPDPTNGLTLGNEANPFVAGSFIAAIGNWKMAYAAINRRPLIMEQFVGGSSMWCVKYQLWAEDGGMIKCCPAARTIYVGA